MPVTWATIDEVIDSFGGNVPSNPADVAHLTRCVASGNDIVYARRVSSGYTAGTDPDTGAPIPEDPTIPPSDRVVTAVVQAATILYRQRGALDAFPSLDELGTYNPPGVGWGQVWLQAGVNKPRGIF
jgi:hypothetical protein